MGRLTERDLTRLSYLMASLVASPPLAGRLIERVLRGGSSPFDDIVREIRTRVDAMASGKPSVATLRELAAEFVRDGDPERQIVGRLLATALKPPRGQMMDME